MTNMRTIATRTNKIDDQGKFIGVYETRNKTGQASYLVYELCWHKRDVTNERLKTSDPDFVLDPNGESPSAKINTNVSDMGPEPTATPEYAACTHTAW
jgi:hypothetical protein